METGDKKMKKEILAMIMAGLMLATIFSAMSVSASYTREEAEPVTVSNSNRNEERADFHFYVWLLAWSHEQIPADGAYVGMMVMDEDNNPDNPPDIQDGYTDENGYIVLHPYIGHCYLIYVNYKWPKYEIVIFSIQEVEGNNCFNVFLIKRHPFLIDSQLQPSKIASIPTELLTS